MIEEKFKKIDELFEKIQTKNKFDLENAMIKPVHEKYPLAQNGIVGLIAPPGSGKSFTYLKLAAQQEQLFNEPFFELIVICSTSNKFDKTVEAYKDVIQKSKLVALKDSDLLSWLNKYMRRILKYNAMMKFIQSDFKDENEEMTRILNKHRFKTNGKQTEKQKYEMIKYIANKLSKYGWRTFPHRCLLILDDFASHPLVRSKETEMSRLLKKLRHFNINVILCVQTTRSLPRDIKRILSDCILFPGISKDDFYDLIKEGPFGNWDADECYSTYKSLTNKHDRMVFHISANRIIMHKSA
jgi:hypothetical protein